MRTCRRCNETYSDSFFQIKEKARAAAAARRSLVCRGCQQHARDTKKRANRSREKARRTIRTHAEKYIRLGIVKTAEEFIKRFSWDIDQIAHDIDHAYQNGCKYCYVFFLEMDMGLAYLTLDIINPKLLPFYKTNTKWVCGTCNRNKSEKSPEKWEEDMYNMKRWKVQQEKLKLNPYEKMPLPLLASAHKRAA